MNRIAAKLLPFLVLSACNIAKGQDVILKLFLNEKPIYCNDISIKESRVSFKNIDDGKIYEYSLNDVSRINFNANQPNEIYIPKLQLDTIRCKVDSISLTELYFRVGDGQQQVLSKESVYCVQFNNIRTETIDLYSNKFLQLNAVQYSNKPKIIRKDGSQIGVNYITSLNGDRLEFRLIKNGVERNTYIDVNDIFSYVNKEPVGERKTIPISDFIVSSDGKFLEAIVTQVNDGTVDYIVNGSFKTVTQRLAKNAIEGIFFFDYSSKKFNSSSNLVYTHNDGLRKFRKVRFDFNAGFGYMLAKTPEDYSDEQKKYIDEMRLGFTMDMNLNMFLSKAFGFGFKFNQYSTGNYNSYPNKIEDNLRIRFYGFSLLSQLELVNDRFYLNSGISLGHLSLVNEGKVDGAIKKIVGQTIGTYIYMGFDYFIEDYISVGIKGGLMNGKIDQLKMNNENIEMHGKENLLRFDGLVNFMIYF